MIIRELIIYTPDGNFRTWHATSESEQAAREEAERYYGKSLPTTVILHVVPLTREGLTEWLNSTFDEG